MADEDGQSKRTFEERMRALLRERYGVAFSKLSPEEVKVLRARFGPKRNSSAIDEERALEKLAHELAALKKKH